MRAPMTDTAAEALRRAVLAAVERMGMSEEAASGVLDGVALELRAERPGERQRRLADEMLAKLHELEPEHGCHAATRVAEAYATDPLEIERIAQNLRRLRRKKKRTVFGFAR
jgi:hypothetical protein